MVTGQPADLTLRPSGTLRIKLAGSGDIKGTQGLGYWVFTATPKEARAVFVPRASGSFDGSAVACAGPIAVCPWKGISYSASMIFAAAAKAASGFKMAK